MVGLHAHAQKLTDPPLFTAMNLLQEVPLVITRADGTIDREPLTARIDTLIEAQYYRNGGIMPYVLRNILK
jgi:aconitase A